MPFLQCTICHKPVRQEDRFCSSCGTKLPTTTSPQQEPPKPAAGAPGAGPSTKQKETTTDNGWHEYKNVWYGFVLEKPIDWEVRTANNMIVISPDDEGYLSATIRPLQLQHKVPAETVAQSLLGSMRKVLPTLMAQGKTLTTNESADDDMFSLHFQATYNNVPIEGDFLVQVLHDTFALISGFQAPRDKIAHLTPTLKRILTSLRLIERLPLQQYAESNEGAFSGFVPLGWSVEARIQRTL